MEGSARGERVCLFTDFFGCGTWRVINYQNQYQNQNRRRLDF
jgi:hypothetical protein